MRNFYYDKIITTNLQNLFKASYTKNISETPKLSMKWLKLFIGPIDKSYFKKSLLISYENNERTNFFRRKARSKTLGVLKTTCNGTSNLEFGLIWTTRRFEKLVLKSFFVYSLISYEKNERTDFS